MNDYVLPHNLAGEERRLRLMSTLLDPLHREQLDRLGLRPGWRCLEIGCGNGSISRWLSGRVAHEGHVTASDIDLRYLDGMAAPNLEIRKCNILEDAVEEGAYDLVTARAVLHHLPSPEKALHQMAAALKPGGVLLSIEPNMLPASAAEPPPLRAFWQGWLRWSAAAGIDYFIGDKLPSLLSHLRLREVAAEGHTAFYNGGSPWAIYWRETMEELRPKLAADLSDALFSEFDSLYSDPDFWTSAITFVAAWGRKP